jgi:hypothetical protein
VLVASREVEVVYALTWVKKVDLVPSACFMMVVEMIMDNGNGV